MSGAFGVSVDRVKFFTKVDGRRNPLMSGAFGVRAA